MQVDDRRIWNIRLTGELGQTEALGSGFNFPDGAAEVGHDAKIRFFVSSASSIYASSSLRNSVFYGKCSRMVDLVQQRYDSFVAWMRAMGLNPNQIADATGISYTTLKSYFDKKGTASLRGVAEAQIASAYGYSVEAIFGATDPAEREISFVTAWRELAGLSLEQLADAAGTTVQIMEMVEAGELPLTGKRRMAVADALNITQGFLLIDPAAAENSLVVASARVTKENLSQATRVLQALAPTGTDG